MVVEVVGDNVGALPAGQSLDKSDGQSSPPSEELRLLVEVVVVLLLPLLGFVGTCF